MVQVQQVCDVLELVVCLHSRVLQVGRKCHTGVCDLQGGLARSLSQPSAYVSEALQL